jgi:hypothetical protein
VGLFVTINSLTLQNEELSPGSSKPYSVDESERKAVANGFGMETKYDKKDIAYLGIAKYDPYYRSPRTSVDLGNTVDGDASPRIRLSTDWSHMTLQKTNGVNKESQWNQVERLVQNDADAMGTSRRPVVTGVWESPTTFNFTSILTALLSRISRWTKSRTNFAVKDVIGASNFAVVTFTSRQAAIAARNCLADGRGYSRFYIINDLPTPPLADAATCDIADCRGCCRPVTVTHSSKLQFARKFFARTIIIGIYIFYAVPINLAVSLINFKQLYGWSFLRNIKEHYPFIDRIISGFGSALLFSSFFSSAPHIFKALSNFGSNAISINQAEFFALKVSFTNAGPLKKLFTFLIFFSP